MNFHLYFDEDSMNEGLVEFLRTRGITVIIASDAGMRKRGDDEQLAYAGKHNYVLCTSNIKHFTQLHTRWLNQGKWHSGMILIPQQQYSIGETGRRILRIMRNRSAEEMENNLEFLSNWGDRREQDG